MRDSKLGDTRSHKALEGGAQSPAGRYGQGDPRHVTNRSEQAADRPTGNFGTGHFGRMRNQESSDRAPFQYGQEDGSVRDGGDPRISFGNQHGPGGVLDDRTRGNFRLNAPSGSEGAHSRQSDKRSMQSQNQQDLMRRMTPLHMISRPAEQQNLYGHRMPGQLSEAQAQSAYMNRQTDKVMDKIMEMEPKSAQNPSGT